MPFIFALALMNSAPFAETLPEIRVHSLFAREDLNLPVSGQKTIISFFSPSSLSRLEEWLEHLSLRSEEVRDLVFINVLWPGGTFFMIPRPKAMQRMEDEILESLAELRHDEDQARLMRSMRMVWVADIERRIHRQLNLKAGPFQAMLLDENGRILGQYEGFSRTQALHLRAHLLSTATSSGNGMHDPDKEE